MIAHLSVGVSDREASRAFYATVLPTLGTTVRDRPDRPDRDFSYVQADAERPLTTGLHVAFAAPDRATVERFHRAGRDAGYRDAGAPGERPQYAEGYFGAFLFDPDGNSIEAVHLGDDAAPGRIDHVWVRVADLAASVRFLAAIAPHVGLRQVAALPGRVRFGFTDGPGTLSLVDAGRDGAPVTSPFHLAYGPRDQAAVAAFPAAALAAGATAHGAGVLDPDGHTVEAVHLTR